MWLTASVAVSVSVCENCFISDFALFLFLTLIVCVCVCVCVSTVLASSWGADEAVNASHWSRQKWLWWVETLSAPLWLCLSPNHLPFYPPTAPISVPLISFLFFFCHLYLMSALPFYPCSLLFIILFPPFLSSLSLFLPVSHISVPPLCAPPTLICLSSDSNSDELQWQDVLPNCLPLKSINYLM